MICKRRRHGKVRISYLARWDPYGSPGVVHKINNTVVAFTRQGYDAHSRIIRRGGLRGHLMLAIAIFRERAQLLVVRATAFSMLVCVPALIVQRVRGVKVVIDVPTPLGSVLSEVDATAASWRTRILRKLLIHVNYPLALYPANRVIQYARESPRFLLGVRKKVLLCGNGIDVLSLPLSPRRARRCNEQIILIAVASLERWHGYDRIIQGLANYYSKIKCGVKICLVVVGEGGARKELEVMVERLGLASIVTFRGLLVGAELSEAFAQADIGISSLGLHRKKLTMASSLKTREYLARGIPVVFAADDPDIPEGVEFIYRAEADDSPIDILDVVRWADELAKCEELPKIIRDFALSKLDYACKVSMYTDMLPLVDEMEA